MNRSRRIFLRNTLATGASLYVLPTWLTSCAPSEKGGGEEEVAQSAAPDMFFKISLAQWSLHRMLKGGQLDNLDFAAKTKNDFGIEAVEYVNQFFMDKGKDMQYLGEMKKRAADNGVESVLIMVDGEGYLGNADAAKRAQAVENHYQWVEAAKFLGCHSIRVNAAGEGTAEEVGKNATEGLHSLASFAQDYGINVIVENHGGYSSDGSWLSKVIADVQLDNCGTLPDFGNFCITRSEDGCADSYDRYQGVKDLMPFAKAVSAKSHDFDAEGNEIHSDYMRIMQTVKEAGYRGYVGIEYEGKELGEEEGIMATKALLEKVGAALGA